MNLLRDPAAEALIAMEVLQGRGRRLLELSHSRVADGPVRDHASRNFMVDGGEELADLVNYCVWGIQQVEARGGPVEVREAFEGALWAALDGFECLERARGVYERWLGER